jgi:hypothetical protein
VGGGDGMQQQGVPNEMTFTIWLYFDENSITILHDKQKNNSLKD